MIDSNEVWKEYFDVEKGIYSEILDIPDKTVEGTVAELAE